MKVDKTSMELYVVTDRTWLGNDTLEVLVEQILSSGATFLQLREKNLSFEEFENLGNKLKTVANKYKIPFVINDNVDIAIKIDADGVHVGQSDMNTIAVRKKIGDNKILGVSVQNPEQAMLAEKQGADYLGVGAMFPTNVKKDADIVTIDTLKKICHCVNIPVVAIGGINEENLYELKNTNVDGIAVISSIFSKENKVLATKSLKEKTIIFRKC